jgi:hypothetical protein
MLSLEYGSFDLFRMFENAIDCARRNPDGNGEPSSAAVPPDGKIPACFHNYPVLKGTSYYSGGGQWGICEAGDDRINTSGRDADCDGS